MKQKDTINKKEFIEWIIDEGIKIYTALGYDRIDPYYQGIIDGYRNIIRKLKDETT